MKSCGSAPRKNGGGVKEEEEALSFFPLFLPASLFILLPSPYSLADTVDPRTERDKGTLPTPQDHYKPQRETGGISWGRGMEEAWKKETKLWKSSEASPQTCALSLCVCVWGGSFCLATLYSGQKTPESGLKLWPLQSDPPCLPSSLCPLPLGPTPSLPHPQSQSRGGCPAMGHVVPSPVPAARGPSCVWLARPLGSGKLPFAVCFAAV